ncbi:MAG: hypothetical protein QOE86_3469 [Solirubrobacteraceae bacterium]|jgi:hypothetical protein|nr:hypothetical protein [Solirubrobacteraceae bacterium]
MREAGTAQTVMAGARHECRRRLDEGQPLHAIEAYIDALPISSDARASLWLWAWAWDERATRDGALRPRQPV